MLSRRLRTFATAFAAVTAVYFGGSRAEAAILIVASSGGTTDVFYSSSSNLAQTPSFTIDGYGAQIDTTVTNFPGSPILSSISTTLNITSAAPGAANLMVSALVVSQVPGLDPTSGSGPLTGAALTAAAATTLLPWTAPASSPVIVTANTSTSSQVSYSAGNTTGTGSATTTTFYDSPPITGQPRTTETGGPPPGTPVVLSGALSLITIPSPNVLGTVSRPNAGTYTLSQSILLTGAQSSTPFNVTGTSTVAPVPEPGTIGLALMGVVPLGVVGLRRLRRRSVGV